MGEEAADQGAKGEVKNSWSEERSLPAGQVAGKQMENENSEFSVLCVLDQRGCIVYVWHATAPTGSRKEREREKRRNATTK
jgi:hypothetical protein